jgi:hypothetical protein
MSLYKYTTASVAKLVLEQSKVRFTQPLAFNDPFDTSPFIVSAASEEEIVELLKELIKSGPFMEPFLTQVATDTYRNLSGTLRAGLGSPEELKSWFLDQMEKKGLSFEHLLRQLDVGELKIRVINALIDKFRREIGVFTLSAIPDSLLMWAHYADAHQGAVIVLDEQHAFFKTHAPMNALENLEVAYTTQRPRITISLDETDEERKLEILKAVFLSKSSEWSYEREYRLIKPFDASTATSRRDKNGYDIHLVDLPADCVTGVIFGCRMKEEDKEAIKNELKSRGLHHVSLKQVHVDAKRFQINIV